MVKGEEFVSKDSVFKQYIFEELSIFDFLKAIQRNGVIVDYIEAMEGVEQDMQTVNGMRMSLEELETNFADVVFSGRELSFAISTSWNEISISFVVNLETNIVVMDTTDYNLELEALMK